jgi:hypothetical protein
VILAHFLHKKPLHVSHCILFCHQVPKVSF